MKQLNFIFLFLILPLWINAQTYMTEGFENTTTLPNDWSQNTQATDGGWIVGSYSALSSSGNGWKIHDNGTTRIIATNDDKCNCNKSQDLLILPPIDASSITDFYLGFDIFYGARSYQGNTETLTLKSSIDSGATWEIVKQLEGHTGWGESYIDLSAYTSVPHLLIGFEYNDGNGWLYGAALDNIRVFTPPALELKMTEYLTKPYGEEQTPVDVEFQIYNVGLTEIDEIEVEYTIDGGTPVTGTISNLALEPFHSTSLIHPVQWTPSASGKFDLQIQVTSVNGAQDDLTDNVSDGEIEIFVDVDVPDLMDYFLVDGGHVIEVASAADNLNKPTDLDFFPLLGKNELWVINQRTENSGGSTVTFRNLGEANEQILHRVDGNAWHFMALPTALAFGNNFNWASTAGIKMQITIMVHLPGQRYGQVMMQSMHNLRVVMAAIWTCCMVVLSAWELHTKQIMHTGYMTVGIKL